MDKTNALKIAQAYADEVKNHEIVKYGMEINSNIN